MKYLLDTHTLIWLIENEYLKKIADLPAIHKDPFDRLIIATALAEDLTIITADENIRKYDAAWIW